MGAAHYYGQTVNKRRIDCIRECSADKYIPDRSVSFISVVTLSFNVQLRTALSPSYRFPSPIFHEIHPIVLYDCNLCANRYSSRLMDTWLLLRSEWQRIWVNDHVTVARKRVWNRFRLWQTARYTLWSIKNATLFIFQITPTKIDRVS